MTQTVETVKQVYLTCRTGGAYKHYLYAIRRQSKPSGHMSGVIDYYLESGWGPIGGNIRSNAAKRIPGGEEEAIRALTKEVRKRTDKGYVRAEVDHNEVPKTQMPNWWAFIENTKTVTKTKAKTFQRKDAPWAF